MRLQSWAALATGQLVTNEQGGELEAAELQGLAPGASLI